MGADLKHFFHPRTIAVIGATGEKTKPGYHLLRKVMERAKRDGGTVYPVNPKLSSLLGLTCYPSLSLVPGSIDVVVVMIGDAEQGVRDAVAKGATFCIVFTAGFSEIGPEGAARERALLQIAQEGGVRLFGPNTNVNAFELFPDIPGRKIALVTQSGHQGRPIAQGVELNIGLSYWAPTGNEADLEFADFVEYFVSHSDTGVIAAYIEGFKSVPRLRAAATAAALAKKPIVMVKVGRTTEGAAMAMSHTGHLTGSDAVVDAFFRQHGIVRVDDLDELLETSALFARLGRPPGDGIAIYAISGGTGAHVADLCAAGGLRLPTLTDETQKKLHTYIPDYLTVANPIDNGAQPVRKPGQNRALIEWALEDPNVDILVCPITGILSSMSEIVCRDIVDAYQSASKPVVVIWGSPVTDDAGYRLLLEGQVPMFRSFRACVVALRRYLDYWKFQDSFTPVSVPPPRVPPGIEDLVSGSGPLSEIDSATIASNYSVPFPWSDVATDEEAAERQARRRGDRVVMKACGPGIMHKTDLGLVRVGVPLSDVRAVWRELDALGRAQGGYDGVLMQPLVEGGEEVIVGFSRDPQFGPVVMFGLGGIFAEVLRDVSLRVAPLTRHDAIEMIREVRGFPLLDGARGRPRADVDALTELILHVSRMATDLRDHVSELDLNPVRVMPAGGGVMALDCLVVRG